MSALARAVAWQAYAACREIGDPELWFSDRAEDREAAKAICRACPVRGDCLDTALAIEGGTSRSTRFGVVGGLAPEARYAEYRRRLAEAGQQPRSIVHGGARHRAPCGTAAAQRRHLRAGETCPRCNTPRPEPQPTPDSARRARRTA